MRAPFGGGGRGRGPSMQHTSRPRNLKRTFKLLSIYLKPYIGLLIMVTAFIIIASLANIIGTFYCNQ